MNIMDKLYKKAVDNYGVCLGLDTTFDFLPEYLQKKDISTGEKIFLFNKEIIDATKDMVACYKVQIACYEALGIEGLIAYKNTLEYIRKSGNIVIADIKRGDISSTATQYAIGHFSGDFESDFITVNTYMGKDAISPYFEYFKNKEKGAFLLVKTSNPNSGDIQDLSCKDGEKVCEKMAGLLSSWGRDFIGKEGFSSIGAVVGLTYPKEFLKLKEYMKNTFFLIPGYGAQGGTGKDIAKVFEGGICGVVNSSRGIIASHKGKEESESFARFAREAVLEMQEDIGKWL